MNILVTGATGFVGRNLVRKLANDGNKVICLVRDRTKSGFLEEFRVKIVFGDILNVTSFEGIPDIDIVYHLAGSVSSTDWKTLYKINAEGTRNIYTFAINRGVKAFIFLSSIAAVGPTLDNKEIDETYKPNPKTKYGRSKLAGEQVIIQRAYNKINSIIIRPPMIYGLDANPESRIVQLCNKLKNNNFLFINSGLNVISLCYIEALIEFMVKLKDILIPMKLEIIHVSDNKHYPFYDLIKLICEKRNYSLPKINLPLWLANLLAIPVTILDKVYSNQVITRERILEITGNWNVSNIKAKKFGFIPNDAFEKIISNINLG